jgi:hypothetical protein
VSTEQPGTNLDDVITAACRGLVGDFERLNGLMAEPHTEDMSAADIARNLGEFGRAQMSGEAKPSAEDLELIAELAADDDLEGTLARRFFAYVSGCVLGWAAAGQLNRASRDDALAIVRERATELFPRDQEARDQH